ncbi:MAG: hypothetical protein C0627_06670 [Sulfurimonas sp.]|nr:MAG: hypothetical protein C0627_06670 [Sulfurimonas sp.]
MDFNALAYPDIVVIAGSEYKCNRNIKENKLLIPYTEEPDIGIDDIIKVKLGAREHEYKVTDLKFMKGGTLGRGTKHHHLLTLYCENDLMQKKNDSSSSVINIGSVHGEQLQIVNHNSQTVNITINDLVEKVSKTNDEEAKILLKQLFENSTVASIIGAGTSALFGIL